MVRWNRIGAGACAGAAALAAAGCGWTARDDFQASRQVVLKPETGDGSRVTSKWDARQAALRTTQASKVASARDDN